MGEALNMKIAVISDVHGNLPALEAVLDEIGRARVYHAGDLVGYNPYPAEVIEIFRGKGIRSVMGNHDNAVLTGNVSWFNPVAAEAILWTRSQIDDEDRSFLASLPVRIVENDFFMVHGSPINELEEYVFPEDRHLIQRYIRLVERDILILGHTHVPFSMKFPEGLVFNPGSVGQPRDGNWRASFAILDSSTGEVEIVRVEYPVEKVVREIKRAGLPQILAERLLIGW